MSFYSFAPERNLSHLELRNWHCIRFMVYALNHNLINLPEVNHDIIWLSERLIEYTDYICAMGAQQATTAGRESIRIYTVYHHAICIYLYMRLVRNL